MTREVYAEPVNSMVSGERTRIAESAVFCAFKVKTLLPRRSPKVRTQPAAVRSAYVGNYGSDGEEKIKLNQKLMIFSVT